MTGYRMATEENSSIDLSLDKQGPRRSEALVLRKSAE